MEWMIRHREELRSLDRARTTSAASDKSPRQYCTLTDRAIRLNGFRAASALAKAFEVTVEAAQLLKEAHVHLPPKLYNGGT
jgi:hypothetical protein